MFVGQYKKQIRIFLFFNLLLVSCNEAYTQEKDSSTFRLSNEIHALFNDNITNPAYTGIFYGHHVQLFGGMNQPFFNYRDLKLPYYAGATYDFSFGKKINQSLGLFYKRLQEGAMSGYMAGLSYAHMFNIHVTKDFYHKIRAGAALFYQREQFDSNLLTFGDMIDPKYGFVWNTSEYLLRLKDTLNSAVSFSGGFWYHNPYGYLGISGSESVSYDTSHRKIKTAPGFLNIAAGGHLYLSNGYAIHPSINIKCGMGELKTLSSWSPALTFSSNDKLYLGFQYKDMNKLTLVTGLNIGKTVFFSLFYGIYPADGLAWKDVAYVGSQLRLKFRN